MGITVYSLAISIVFYNLALIAVFILRRSPGFRARHTVSLLAFITVLGVVRLVLPIDFDAAYVVRSYTIIPAIEDFLKRPLAASFTYGHLLLALWAVGSFVMVIKDIRLQWRFDRYLQSIDFVDRSELLEIAAEYGNDFAVLISPQLNMPFTSGILHPVIYLPDVELSGTEWRMVFCHEITHIRSHDNLKKLFFLAVEALFWWNPLAHFSRSEINALVELRCDRKVTKKMNRQERLRYEELLKKLLELTSSKRTSYLISSFLGSKLHLRFLALEDLKDTEHLHYTLPIIVALAFVFSYFVIIQPIRHPLKDDLIAEFESSERMVSYIESENAQIGKMYIQYNDGQYYLYIDGKETGTISADSITEPPLNTLLVIGEPSL